MAYIYPRSRARDAARRLTFNYFKPDVKMADFFECECMVRGYHKYKDVWEAEFGITLQCQWETGNPHDIYAVAVLKSGVIPEKINFVPNKRRGVYMRLYGSKERDQLSWSRSDKNIRHFLFSCFSDVEERFTVQLLVQSATLLI